MRVVIANTFLNKLKAVFCILKYGSIFVPEEDVVKLFEILKEVLKKEKPPVPTGIIQFTTKGNAVLVPFEKINPKTGIYIEH